MTNPRARVMRWRAFLVLGVCLGAGPAAAAGACAVSSTGLAFGAYQPLTFPGKLSSVDKTSTATVSVVCSGIVTGGGYTISLGPGNYGPGDRIGVRYLNNTLNGGDSMIFNAYVDSGYNTVWGNGVVGSTFGGNMAAGASSQTHTVYGKVPAGQNTLKAGSFSDSLTMTITYNP